MLVTNTPKLTRQQREALMAERRAEMWRMRVDGWSQQQIADHYGVTQSAVSLQLSKAYKERPAAAIDEYRTIELDKLDQAERAVLAVLRRRHVTVSQGRVVTLTDPDTGEPAPLLDDGPVLNAVDRLVALSRQRARLLGLEAPTRSIVEARNLTEEIAQLVSTLTSEDDDDDDGGT